MQSFLIHATFQKRYKLVLLQREKGRLRESVAIPVAILSRLFHTSSQNIATHLGWTGDVRVFVISELSIFP